MLLVPVDILRKVNLRNHPVVEMGMSPIVGSTKGLIENIKARKKVKHIQLDKAVHDKAPQDAGLTDEGPIIAEKEARGDGIQVEVNPSEDDYGAVTEEDEVAQRSESSSEGEGSGSENTSDSDCDGDDYSRSSDEGSEGYSAPEQGGYSEEFPLSEESDEETESLRQNPKVQKMLQEMKQATLTQLAGAKDGNRKSKSTSNKRGKLTGDHAKLITTPLVKQPANLIKSPSDTTIYAPALKRGVVGVALDHLPVVTDLQLVGSPSGIPHNVTQSFIDPVDQISSFVENIRMGLPTSSVDDRPKGAAGSPRADDRDVDPQQTEADRIIINAEKFKASVEKPKGEHNQQVCHVDLSQLMQLIIDNTDDEFFHLTCHIEPALRIKIEASHFVELEWLLPKSRSQVTSNEQRMQFINKNGASYWIPAERETHITGVRRWDQAFRIYAAIYCKANPSRATEIWQYIHVINTAATTYSWENVSYYDITFRHMMAQKPTRSWDKIYNQLWNLAMCDPISRTMGGNGSSPLEGNCGGGN